MTLSEILIIGLFFIAASETIQAQQYSPRLSFLPQNISIAEEAKSDSYPDPKKAFRRSLIIPGWGQITNRQIWKVPIVYGVLGGLVYYSIYVHGLYTDYRAAYYNASVEDSDFRFGPTPAYLEGVSPGSLQSIRDTYRNRRDLVFAAIGIAWILNGVEAYVAAHLKPFDVSDDLSMNTTIEPVFLTSAYQGLIPGMKLSISLSR